MNSKGFSLLEVLISLFLFSFLLAGLGPAFLAHVRRNTDSELRTEAMEAAQYVLDQLRLEDPTSLQSSGSRPAEAVSVNGREYDVVVSFCTRSEFCATNNNRHIGIEVQRDNRLLFKTETVYTLLR